MMPTLTLPPSPNGLPIAITQSPTRLLSESPNFTVGSGALRPARSSLSSARSVLGSVPTSSALKVESSLSVTVISSASAMTWLLVTT